MAYEVERCIRVFSGQKQCEIQELNIQVDHVHVIAMIPPKLSVSDYLGLVKGRTAIRVFKKFPKLKVRPYWGNHFWAPGYCVDTIGLDEEKIRQYVQYQEKREKHETANIDSILDKISAKGYDKLTTTEKRILENYSRKQKEDSE